ncbi:uncharacterized protein LOC141685015 [Apium graveolens]|uniref:uncharacterized protein LOC141685015 n=1 Tax=Apium graveolens TaxID=4045 RepID=UPI003D7B98DB
MSTWSKPNVGSAKVNVKGGFHRAHMRSAIGCVMMDCDGDWIRGCKSMIGLVVPVTAALWSIFYALEMAWENDEKSVVMECDCEEAVALISNIDSTFDMFKLVCMIRNLMSEEWELYELVHIVSSANIAVTALSNRAISDDGGLVELSFPPSYMLPLLVATKRV